MPLNNESEVLMSSPNYVCTVSDAFPQSKEEFLEDQILHSKLYPDNNTEVEKENILIRILSLLTGKA
jgi:hypothetical protein